MAMILRGQILVVKRLVFGKTLPKATVQNVNFCKNSFKNRDVLVSNSSVYIVPKRSISRFFKKPSVHKYKQLDNIPDRYELIYRNTMDRYVFAAHVVTFVTAVVVTLIAIIKQDIQNASINFDDWKEKPRATENEVLIYVTSAILLAVIVQSLIGKFPLRIYKVPKLKKYIFVFSGTFPTARRRVECQIGHLKYIGGEGIVPWKESLYVIENKQNVILLDQFFHKPADLYVMLGEQKDPDDE